MGVPSPEHARGGGLFHISETAPPVVYWGGPAQRTDAQTDSLDSHALRLAMSGNDKLLSDFLRDCYVPYHLGLSTPSADKLELACRLFSSWIGHPARLSDLSEEAVLGWLSERLQSQAAWTVKRNRGELLAIWRFAAKRGLSGPVPEIPTIRVPRRMPVAWRLEEFERLVAAAR
ncbi:unnamed protein product, partial [marine sediment metagenome]